MNLKFCCDSSNPVFFCYRYRQIKHFSSILLFIAKIYCESFYRILHSHPYMYHTSEQVMVHISVEHMKQIHVYEQTMGLV